jgi:S1-C subfamily serine protease
VIGAHRPGETVKLRIVRDGRTLSVDVKLGKRPDRGR